MKNTGGYSFSSFSFFGRSNLGISLLALLVGMTFSACSKQESSDENLLKNYVAAQSPDTQAVIGDEEIQFEVKAQGALQNAINKGSLKAPENANALPETSLSRMALSPQNRALPINPNPAATSLSVAIPMGLAGRAMQFGGVITKVSDSTSEDLGMLKLTDLPPFQVKAVLAKDSSSGAIGLALMNCESNCATIDASERPLIIIPASGVDEAKKRLVLDVSALAKGLEITSTFKNSPVPSTLRKAKLVIRSSSTTAVDYSASTLTWDVTSEFIPSGTFASDSSAPVTTIVTRWYLKLNHFNPSFKSREPRNEVGFFTTDRGVKPLITRFDQEGPAKKAVKYYLKNVPQEHRKAFSGALDRWNDLFVKVTGKPIFRYEFIESNDPRAQVLVAGDVRYNIIEWDMDNQAPYGGLGPSIANQYTGETFAANVLVQGPRITKIYKEWFATAKRANRMSELGNEVGAQALLAQFTRNLRAENNRLQARDFSVSLAGNPMIVRSAQESLADPLFKREDFEDLPTEFDYDSYMVGYFHDMLVHELGHNVGLRHNFRGNLGAAEKPELGKVSRSIMEYLGREHRHLDDIGPYDLMAIGYGYMGQMPKAKDWFCTDEDQFHINGSGTNPFVKDDPTKSAECSKIDATQDPFSYQTARLAKIMGLAAGLGTTEAPSWTADDLAGPAESITNNIGAYALSAQFTASKWTNFFGKPGRPVDGAGVPAYVLSQVKSILCDPRISQTVEQKGSATAKQATSANISKVRAQITDLLKPVFSASDLACQ